MDTAQSIMISAICGIIGTSVGGILTALLPLSQKTGGKLFSLSAGMMLELSLGHLIPEALSLSRFFALTGALCGYVITATFDKLLKQKTGLTANGRTNQSLNPVSTLIFAAIALHNIPEGIAIGAGAATDIGLLTAVAIGLHNIPEGMSVAIPIVANEGSRSKGILYAAVSGTPTLLGGIIGSVAVDKYSSLVPLSLGTAAGAMLAVCIFELLKNSADEYALSMGIAISLGLSLL